jgi:hypothetical protein
MSNQVITIIVVLILMYLVYFYYVRPKAEEEEKKKEEEKKVVPDAKVVPNPCATYALGDTNLSDECLKNIWASNGCINESTVNIPNAKTWWKAQTHQGVKDDMRQWATLTSTLHREGCYGTDRSRWPT